MPTKIVSTVSNNRKGEINIEDLTKIIDDFKLHTSLSSDSSTSLVKLNEVSIPLIMLQNLLAEVDPGQRLSSNVLIKFGITLPTQTDCEDGQTVLGNHLTVAIVLETGGVEKMDTGNSVITTGYREYVGPLKELSEGPCCPVIKPGS